MIHRPDRSIGQLDLLFLSREPQFTERSRFDLPHTLLGDPHFVADFLERQRFLAVIEPEATNDNFLFAFVKAR